jgi:hypothetical protein
LLEIVLLLVVPSREIIERKSLGVPEKRLDKPIRAITVQHHIRSLMTIDKDTFGAPSIAPTKLLEECINDFVRCLWREQSARGFA